MVDPRALQPGRDGVTGPVLDAAAVRRWCEVMVLLLEAHRPALDALNVYPVPDGDTGTNLARTAAAAAAALPQGGPPPDGGAGGDRDVLLDAVARAALLGARGNSGVILAGWLRGLTEGLAGRPGDAVDLSGALGTAATAARAAVAAPVEGTILTVATAVAHRAAAAARSPAPATDLAARSPASATQAAAPGLAAVLEASVAAAVEAVEATTSQLPALRAAGVVDAAGRGLLLVLAALWESVTGQPARIPPAAAPTCRPELSGHAGETFGYEVQYLLDAGSAEIQALCARLATLGDSLVTAPADAARTTWSVHVHVDDVGAAIEAGVEAGRPYRISVTRFADQAAAPAPPAAADRRAWVVAATGSGLTDLIRAEGAAVVPPDADADALHAAIGATGADRVVLLVPAGTAAAAAARRAHRDGVVVEVIPVRSPVPALAALAVRDPGRRFADEVIAMAEAAGSCRSATVVTAAEEALTVAGRCRPGDQLGLVEGEVVLIGTDRAAVGRDLVDTLLAGGGELVTLLADPTLVADLTAHAARRWPLVEVRGYAHDQLVIGVE